jgi:hypothetical protein
VVIVLKSKRTNSCIQLIQNQIAHIDRCINARQPMLAKNARNLHSLHLELMGVSIKNHAL